MSVGKEWEGSFLGGSIYSGPNCLDPLGLSSALSPGWHHAFCRQPEPGEFGE